MDEMILGGREGLATAGQRLAGARHGHFLEAEHDFSPQSMSAI
jgi:hypothetical protein